MVPARQLLTSRIPVQARRLIEVNDGTTTVDRWAGTASLYVLKV